MIDKKSDTWKGLPLFVKCLFVGPDHPWLGTYNRKSYVRGEKMLVLAGILCFLASTFHYELFAAGAFFIIAAYIVSLHTRIGDHYSIWQKMPPPDKNDVEMPH